MPDTFPGAAPRLRGRPALAGGLVAVLAVSYALALALTPERVLVGLGRVGGLGLRRGYEGVRLFQDNFDRDIFISYGGWVRGGRIPYRDVPSEYPQVATYLFGAAHVLGGVLGHRRLAFSLIGLGFWAVLVGATWCSLVRLGRPPARALLLCLPASLYFSANRYDACAAALVGLSLVLLLAERPRGAMVLLGLGVLTKWYPALLAPIYFAYLWRRDRGSAMWSVLVLAGVVGVFMLQTVLWAGPAAAWAPYGYQLAVDGNAESLYGLLRSAGAGALAYKPAFLALQFAAVPLVLLRPVDTEQRLLDASAFVVMCFIFFANFHSPQWLLWVCPLLILCARSKFDLALVGAYDLLTFAYFPLGYDLYEGRWVFRAILVIHAALRLAVLVRLGSRALARHPDVHHQAGEPAADLIEIPQA